MAQGGPAHDPRRCPYDAGDRPAVQRRDTANARRRSSPRSARCCARRSSATRSTRRLRIAHFLGQTCVESAGFRTTEEFADGTAYEGRKDLGNTEPGDGPRFKGRGLIQLTGRSNYRAMGKTLKLDLENNPAQAAEPALSLVIACEYWKSRKINDAADQDDVMRVTRLINGGLNGLDGSARVHLPRQGRAGPAGGHPGHRCAARGDPRHPASRRQGRGGRRAAAEAARPRLRAGGGWRFRPGDRTGGDAGPGRPTRW